MMLFSQILFIIYAMFLPVSFLMSMIPTYENMAKQAVVRVFNAIMTRAGITLVVTVAFSISSMFYNISNRLSVLYGGIFADNLFCRNLHEARRANEYVQPECQ